MLDNAGREHKSWDKLIFECTVSAEHNFNGANNFTFNAVPRAAFELYLCQSMGVRRLSSRGGQNFPGG